MKIDIITIVDFDALVKPIFKKYDNDVDPALACKPQACYDRADQFFRTPGSKPAGIGFKARSKPIAKPSPILF